MQITEILDSTTAWATLNNIDIESMYNGIKNRYTNVELIIRQANSAKKIYPAKAYSSIDTVVNKRLSTFRSDADTFINVIARPGINDPDVNNMLAEINTMLSKLNSIGTV